MSRAGISVVFVTGREEPAFDWFASSLARQLGDGDDIEVIVVDRHLSEARTERFLRDAAGRFPLRHVSPKPSPWQGPHRLTSRDSFAASNARNSGLVHARAPYVVFVDDCAVLMPGWWSAVRRGARGGDVVAGAYERRSRMVVRGGVMIEGRLDARGRDARWPSGDDALRVPIEGGQLYGASFAAPRELLLSINGLDEMCDGLGQEDVHLGMRIAATGATIWYDRAMLTIESEELNHAGTPLPRNDRWMDEADYLRRLADFGVHRRATSGRTDASHMMLDIVLGTGSWATHGNYYWLADLTPDGYAATIRRFPRFHWFDACPLSTL